MPLRIQCPGCQTGLQIADAHRGQKVRCPKCNGIMQIPAGPVAAPASAPAPLAVLASAQPPEAITADPLVRQRTPAAPSLEIIPPMALPVHRPPDELDLEVPLSARRPSSVKKNAGQNGLPLWIKQKKVVVAGVSVLGSVVVGTLVAMSLRGKPADTVVARGKDPKQTKKEQSALVAPELEKPVELPRPKQVEVPSGTPPPFISPEAIQKVKQATAYLKVTQGNGAVTEGSGFFAIEPGLVFTNAHVLGMLSPASLGPKDVEVVVHSGEPEQFQLSARVLGVDRDNDLAILSVIHEPQRWPAPLAVDSTRHLTDLQKVYVFGFPFGATLGPNITVSDSSISSLRKSPDGIVTQIQVNGGMNPGNSGGPLVDTRGVVVGVAVSIIRGTQINFAIPGDKLPGLLRGRVTRIQFGEPFVEGKRVKLPLELECLDPLERIRDLKIAVWSGKPGNAHPPSTKTPDPSPGDGPRQFFPLAYREGKAEVEIDLPPWDYSKVVWVQPVLTDGIQSAYWAEAFAYKPTAFAPLERKPANLRYRFDVQSERSVKMRSTLKLQAVRGPQQLSTAKTMEAEALETVHPDARGGAFRLKIGSSKSSTEENGQTKPTELQAEKLVRDQSLDFLTDPAGSLLGRGNSPTLDKSKPAALRGEFEDLVNRIANTYELTFVSVPGKELQPKETWITRLPLMVIKDGKKDVVDILAIGTFEGVRLHEGQQLALIALTGTLRERNGSVAAGRFSGKVHFSLDRGYVTLAEVKVEAEFSMGDTIAMQTLEVQLSRSAGNLLKNAP